MSFLFIMTMICYSFAVGRWTRTWSHPAVIFGIFWSLYSMAALVAVPEIKPNPLALSYILAAVVAFGLPSLFLRWHDANLAARSRQNIALPFPTTLTVFVVALQGIAIVCVFVNLIWQGFSLLDLVRDPLRFAGNYVGARYTGHAGSTAFSQVGTLTNYVAVPLGGIVITHRMKWYRAFAILVIIFLPCFLYFFVYGDKGTLPLSISYFYGGLAVGWISRGSTSFLTRKSAIFGAIAFAFLIPIAGLALVIKGVGAWQWSDNYAALRLVLYYFKSYAFGSFYAFNDWLRYYIGQPSITAYSDHPGYDYGFRTFLAIGKLVNPNHPIPPGYYSEYFTIPDVIKTNIYTMFRGAIIDFGIPGSLVFFAVFGWVGALAYRSMLKHVFAPLSQAFYIATIGAIYSSYLISNGTWTTPYIAAGCIAVLLFSTDFMRQDIASLTAKRPSTFRRGSRQPTP